MRPVLVVDDSPVDRHVAVSLIKHDGMSVLEADCAERGLEILAADSPSVVLTDMQMPGLSGLDLVREIRRKYPAIPVVLMTAHGSEELAVQALQQGAASYVNKQNLARDLIETIHEVGNVAIAARKKKWLLNCWQETQSRFTLVNEVSGISVLVEHLQDNLSQLDFCDEGGLIHLGTALHEALVNAIEHGNLELASELREQDTKVYRQLVQEKAREAPYWKRRVHVASHLSRAEARFVIRDEGPGFDPGVLPDPTDPANLEKPFGRGLFLIRTFMDEVHFNDAGNEITLVKRRAS